MRHPSDLDPLVFGCAGFEALLAARAVCRAWRRRGGPRRGSPLWRAVAPPRAWLRSALTTGSIKFLQFLDSVFWLELTEGHAAMHRACAAGDLAKVQWLVGRFNPSANERVAGLGFACVGGHLPVVKWIVGRSRLKKRDIRPLWTAALPRLCGAAGGLPVLRWLARHFAMVARDLPWPSMLAAACAAGQLPTVRWLYGQFGLASCIDPPTLAFAAEAARRHGHIEILEWLASPAQI